MENQPLHPDLARLDAAYDDITARFARGEIDASGANTAIAALVGRDDEGTMWHKDPRNGGWLRRTHSGDLVIGTPPAYGVATPTPYDLSPRAGSPNPDQRIAFHPVDETEMYGENSLRGATRRPVGADTTTSWNERLAALFPTMKHKIIAAAVLVVVLILLITVVTSVGSSGPSPAPVPSTVPTLPTTPPVIPGT